MLASLLTLFGSWPPGQAYFGGLPLAYVLFIAILVTTAIYFATSKLFVFKRVAQLGQERLKQRIQTLETKLLERAQQSAESEVSFRTFANCLPELAWIAHADGTVYWYNDEWYKYTGTELGKLEPLHWTALLESTDEDRILNEWNVALEQKSTLELQVRLQGRDRDFKWFLIRMTPLYNSSGKLERWLGTSTNIDAQKRAQEQLHLERKKLYEFFMSAPIPVALLEGPEHIYVLQNPAYFSIVGGRNLLGKPVREALPEMNGQGFYEVLDQVFVSGAAVTGTEIPRQLLQADGKLKLIYYSSVYQPWFELDGSVKGVLVLAFDVTAQVNARIQIENQEKWLNAVLDQIPVPLKFNDPMLGSVIFANKAAKLLPKEVKERLANWGNGDSGKDRFTEDLSNQELNWETPQGHYSLLINAKKIPEIFGHPETVLATFQDVSDLKRIEFALNEAILARDEFLSIASHELKTPITSLKLQTQMTLRAVDLENNKVPTPEKLVKSLNLANRQILRLERLVEDLLDVAKIRSGKLTFFGEEINLSSLMKEVGDRFEHQLKDLGAKIEYFVDDAIVGFWDRARIEQVVVNLLSNAIKYAPGKNIEIGVEQKNSYVWFSVRDHGPGIPAEKHCLIFERFERATSGRNVSGLGLGLYIVKQLLEGHQGKIWVESEEGRGAKFIVELPLYSHFTSCLIPPANAFVSFSPQIGA